MGHSGTVRCLHLEGNRLVSGSTDCMIKVSLENRLTYYAPKLREHIGFGLSVRLSHVCHILWTMHAGVLKFRVWIPHGKIADTHFLSCLSCLPFWSYAPLKNSEWNLMHAIILWPVHVRVLKFHIWIDSSWKNSWPVFVFLSELSPFLELYPFEKVRMKSCQKTSRKVFELGAWNLVSW